MGGGGGPHDTVPASSTTKTKPLQPTSSPIFQPSFNFADKDSQPQPQKMNIFDLLLEIKGKQETSDIKLETVIEDKMKDTESNTKLVSEMNNALHSADVKFSTLSNKTNVVENELSQQKKSMYEIDDKVVTLEDRSNVLEGEFLKLKCTTDQNNLSLSDMVTNVEHKLVSHLETIKLNVEKEISSSKLNQIHVEYRLSDFTKEIQSQTIEMNNKMQELKSPYHLSSI